MPVENDLIIAKGGIQLPNGGAPDEALVPTSVKYTNYNILAGQFVPTVTTSGVGIVHTLPNAPLDQTRCGVKLVSASGTLSIHTQGSDVFNIAGGATSLSVQAKNQSQIYQYSAAPKIWYVTADDTPIGGGAYGAAKLGVDGTVGGAGGSPLSPLVLVSGNLGTNIATLTSGTLTPAQVPSSVVLDSQLGIFPVGNYASLNAAIIACNAAGGGVVRLPVGETAVSAKVTLLSNVVVEGPDLEWSVTQGEPVAWLQGDSSTSDPIVEIPTTTTQAALHNLGIVGTGTNRQGVLIDYSATVRGGNRLRNVQIYGCGSVSNPAVYVGQLETRMEDLFVYYSVGDGLEIDAQDCNMEGANAVGYSGSRGLILTTNSGPLVQGGSLDVFDNGTDGIQINGVGHRLTLIQSNNNGYRNLAFLTTTSTVIVHYTGGNASQSGTGLYPDVEFAHPTAGNLGCGILGGGISTSDGKALYGVHNAEAVVTFPLLIGISFSTGWSSGNSPFQITAPGPYYYQTRGCINVPDCMVAEGGVSPQSRPISTTDQYQWTDGGGNALAGVKYNGFVYAPTFAPTSQTGATGAARYFAATVAGPPQSGTWAVGDVVPDHAGTEWVCVAAGTPGSWVQVGTLERYLLNGSAPYRESLDRRIASGSTAPVGGSGVMILASIVLYPGDVITNLHLFSGTALTMGTNSDGHIWAALYSPTLSLLSQSADGGGSFTWAAHTWQKFVLGAAQTITTLGVYYAALMINYGTGGTPALPQILGNVPVSSALAGSGNTNQPPSMVKLGATSGSGLTTTAPAGPITLAQQSPVPYVCTS